MLQHGLALLSQADVEPFSKHFRLVVFQRGVKRSTTHLKAPCNDLCPFAEQLNLLKVSVKELTFDVHKVIALGSGAVSNLFEIKFTTPPLKCPRFQQPRFRKGYIQIELRLVHWNPIYFQVHINTASKSFLKTSIFLTLGYTLNKA